MSKVSREQFLKDKSLDEARKAGTAPAELDEQGREINPVSFKDAFCIGFYLLFF